MSSRSVQAKPGASRSAHAGLDASAPGRRRRWRWWHAAGFAAAVNLPASAVSLDWAPAVYNPLAPPDWAYGPAWTLNDLVALAGNLRLLNLPAGTPGRRALLGLQAASWTIYATFCPVYFGLRSPILGAVWTAGMYAVTLASAALARRVDRRVAMSLLPLLTWLTLATPAATYAALHGADPVFATRPS